MELMIKHTKRILIFFLAVIFVLVGIAGLILPLIPGLVFFALALIIFSIFFPLLGDKARAVTRKYPKLDALVEKLDMWVRRMIGDL
ncbi:MAG: hypothetical protein G01um101456_246 [Parcubacteria group bacterium Gr01-1014_56]|nr:MAG: hypothetical protein G01um101456_246 [Parcubacteria group bacterium Gr01-1014_56]